MTIYTVVYVGDGVLYNVDVYTDKANADARFDELVESEGCSLESLGYETAEEIGGYCQEWGEEVRVVNGKHYIVNEADCLSLCATEIPDKKIIFLPCREEAEEASKRELSDDEFTQVCHDFENGIEGQIDWHMALSCAADNL